MAFRSCRIYLAQPTNDSVNRTVTRLKKKGFPLDRLLVVRGEHAFGTARRVDGVTYVKVTRYYPNDGIQLIVGTVNVLARLRLHRDNTVSVMLKPPAAVLVCILVVWLFGTLNNVYLLSAGRSLFLQCCGGHDLHGDERPTWNDSGHWWHHANWAQVSF